MAAAVAFFVKLHFQKREKKAMIALLPSFASLRYVAAQLHNKVAFFCCAAAQFHNKVAFFCYVATQ